MKGFLLRLFAVIGVLATLLVVLISAGLYFAYRQFASPPELPDRMVLTLDLRGTLDNSAAPHPIAWIRGERRASLDAVLLALARASEDPRVVGLFARIDASAHGLAAAQELRQAILRFRASGKPSIVHASSLGETGAGNEGYFIASAFGEIWMQPGGLVSIVGLALEIPFFRDLLDRLGVDPEVTRREEYKTAFESFTERQPTPANREMQEAILDELSLLLRDGIARARSVPPARVAEWIDKAPWVSDEARANGLVDHLGYLDEAEAAMHAAVGDDARFVPVTDYAASTEAESVGEAPLVAFVHASGTIREGEVPAGQGIGAESLRQVFEEIRDNEQVKAVLLRLDSPGGSAVASITLAREIDRLRQAGKPVVVSMINLGASGGYWIAARADRILASPATLTGSIGVIYGKPVLSRLWRKLGVNWYRSRRGRNAAIGSINEPYDEEERARVEKIVDDLYARFKQVVAEGRGLDPDRVEKLARGRVWTGRQALERHLVDRLGGLREAEEELRDLLGLPPRAALRLAPFPPPEGWIGWLRRLGRPLALGWRIAGRIPFLAEGGRSLQAPPLVPR